MYDAIVNGWQTIPTYIQHAVIILLAIFVLLKLWNWATGAVSSWSSASTHVAMMIKTAARYAAAAQQDVSPLMSLTHINYAAAYLQLLREQHDLTELNAATTIDFVELQSTVQDLQSQIYGRMVESCPAVAPTNSMEVMSMMS